MVIPHLSQWRLLKLWCHPWLSSFPLLISNLSANPMALHLQESSHLSWLPITTGHCNVTVDDRTRLLMNLPLLLSTSLWTTQQPQWFHYLNQVRSAYSLNIIPSLTYLSYVILFSAHALDILNSAATTPGLTLSVPVTGCFLLFIKQAKHSFASGPLHILFSQLGMLFLQAATRLTYHLIQKGLWTNQMSTCQKSIMRVSIALFLFLLLYCFIFLHSHCRHLTYLFIFSLSTRIRARQAGTLFSSLMHGQD